MLRDSNIVQVVVANLAEVTYVSNFLRLLLNVSHRVTSVVSAFSNL